MECDNFVKRTKDSPTYLPNLIQIFRAVFSKPGRRNCRQTPHISLFNLYRPVHIYIYGNRATTAIPYYLCGSRLTSTDVVKDLGVTMNCYLQFSDHVNSIVGKAHSRAYLIRKCFISRNPPLLIPVSYTHLTLPTNREV